MTRKCLITGGAGFIGSHLAHALLADGWRVRVLDDLSTGLSNNLTPVNPSLELHHGDVTDAQAVGAGVEGAEVVFHLAALASVALSLEKPAETHRVCAGGTLTVLDAARRAGVRRFIYAASSSAYGMPTRPVQSETDPLMALSPYAAAKLAGELYAQAFHATFGLETVRLRFFNVFGPRQRADSPYSGVIALFAAALAADRRPKIFGDGLQTRDFIYVSDVVAALLRAAEVPAIGGQVFNIGTGRPTNLIELVATLNRLLGKKISCDFAPARPGDVRHSCADVSRAREMLGFEPKITFEAGLERTLGWLRTGP